VTDARLLKRLVKRVQEFRSSGVQEGPRVTQEEASRLSGFDYNYYQPIEGIEGGEKNLSLTRPQQAGEGIQDDDCELVRVQ